MNNSNILVVEDDFAIRNLITTALETEKYKYHVAKNGNQAIIEAATQPPERMITLPSHFQQQNFLPESEETIEEFNIYKIISRAQLLSFIMAA